MQYAVPAIIAMTASSLYNMVDSIFIGHIPGVGHYAISGLAVTFPLMNLSTALGTLVGVGASTMLSVLLGQRNYKAAGKVLTNEFLLNIIIGLIFSAVTIAFLSPILCFFGASENTLPYARDYMFIILLGNVVTHLYFGLNNVIRASGHPKMAMGLTIFTVLFNTVLDPIFIFGFGMGIKGAALATVICQCIALAYTLRFFFDQNNFLHLPARLKDFRLDMKVAMDSLTIGMGPFLMNSASCIVTMLINQQLLKYGGDLAIGAYGIVNRISFLFIMVNMGFNQGMQPIAGYNFGARKYTRVKEVYRLTVICATAVTSLGFIVSEAIPGPAVSVFTSEPEGIGCQRIENDEHLPSDSRFPDGLHQSFPMSRNGPQVHPALSFQAASLPGAADLFPACILRSHRCMALVPDCRFPGHHPDDHTGSQTHTETEASP